MAFFLSFLPSIKKKKVMHVTGVSLASTHEQQMITITSLRANRSDSVVKVAFSFDSSDKLSFVPLPVVCSAYMLLMIFADTDTCCSLSLGDQSNCACFFFLFFSSIKSS